MPGAERKRSFDLDGDRVRWNVGAIVSPVDEKAAGADRFQSGEARFDPVLFRERLEGQRRGTLLADNRPDQADKPCAIIVAAQDDFDCPGRSGIEG
jgi:hypothetical protein